MGVMGLFLFATMGIISIHDKEGRLSPATRLIFLRYVAWMLLLGDLTKKQTSTASGTDEESLAKRAVHENTNSGIQDDDTAAGDGESTAEEERQDPKIIGKPSQPPTATESAEAAGSVRLISSVDELTKTVRMMAEGLTSVKTEAEVSDYTLLANVLDRLCLVVYLIITTASVPIIMYWSV
ncbi:uncharacterized protein LOC144925341 [Branchiostoma floridae x Branchiostoma belcheri]